MVTSRGCGTSSNVCARAWINDGRVVVVVVVVVPVRFEPS
jgi:hypothetical protein